MGIRRITYKNLNLWNIEDFKHFENIVIYLISQINWIRTSVGIYRI